MELKPRELSSPTRRVCAIIAAPLRALREQLDDKHTPRICAVALLAASLYGCSAPVPIDDIDDVPRTVDADRTYAGVFAPLDGAWRGTFHTYLDPRGQARGKPPTALDDAFFEHLKPNGTLEVHQRYASESPYFQRVAIEDHYPNGRVVKSRGVNKIQGGKMWCVVHKPDDLVVHHGTTAGPHTIVWRRHRDDPLAVEYFRETVEGDVYRIVGWGYYGHDDPSLTPRMYFRARYHRQ